MSFEQIEHYNARQDFAMAAGSAHEAIGEYQVARVFYEMHGRTCLDPLCSTMQRGCYQQAGRFAEAYQLVRDGLELMRAHEHWRINPFALWRLAWDLFDELLDRDRVAEARLAFAQRQKIVSLWPDKAFAGKMTRDEWLRRTNLDRASIARSEDDPATAVAICREVVAHPDRAEHRKGRFTALRALGLNLYHNDAFEEAHSIYDELVSVDPDGAQHGGLADRAMRARARIGMENYEEAREELGDVFAMAEDAVATRATVLIYQSELLRALGDTDDEVRVLTEALQHYATEPGAPIDMWGVRTALKRLRELSAISPDAIAGFGFSELPEWPRDVLAGTGEWAVDTSDARFPLVAVWEMP